MKVDFVLVILIIFSVLWFILHLTDRRRILNGFVFMLSLGSLLAVMLYIGLRDEITILRIISGSILLFFLILVPILFSYLLVTFIALGIKLMRKEGITLSHSLSFLLGIMVFISVFIYPFIIQKVENIIIRTGLNYSINLFTMFTLGFIVYFLSSIIYTFYYYRKNQDYIIVLGSGLNKDKVTPLLAARVDKAISFYDKQVGKTGKRLKLVMSGGQGENELVAEAEAMKDYAISQGIPETDIICEDKSKSTRENLINSIEIIKIDSKKDDIESLNIMFATSNYHVFRAALLTKELDLNIGGIGSRVKLYFYISAIIREYIGALSMNAGSMGILAVLIFLYTIGLEYLQIM